MTGKSNKLFSFSNDRVVNISSLLAILRWMQSKYNPNWFILFANWIHSAQMNSIGGHKKSEQSQSYVSNRIVRYENRKSIPTNDYVCHGGIQFKVPCNPFSLMTIHIHTLSSIFSSSKSSSMSHVALFLSYKNINLFAMFYSSCNIKCFHFGFGASFSLIQRAERNMTSGPNVFIEYWEL